jgi:hypothetical protein
MISQHAHRVVTPDLSRAFMVVQRGLRVKRGIWRPFNNVRYQAHTTTTIGATASH